MSESLNAMNNAFLESKLVYHPHKLRDYIPLVDDVPL